MEIKIIKIFSLVCAESEYCKITDVQLNSVFILIIKWLINFCQLSGYDILNPAEPNSGLATHFTFKLNQNIIDSGLGFNVNFIY